MNPIRTGERSGAVRSLQAQLIRLGLPIEAGEIGTFGASTESAVRAFQQRRGLNVDGVVGEATWRELHESAWVFGSRSLKLQEAPMRGDDVRALQAALNALGFSAGKHDGIFGGQTVEAVREFQHDLAIEEDGIVGPSTIRALERLRIVLKPGLGPRVRERERRQSVPRGLSGKRIVIDPGHGGEDPGHLSPSGDSESEICFRIAASVAQLLETESASAVLTRGPNDGPEDSDRSEIANWVGADLFLSIHLNAHSNESASGAATYFFEHDSVASEPGEHLADGLRRALVESGRQDCRSHGRNYPLLRETRMPAIVVEPCFLTNPEEAKFLADPEGIQATAVAIVRGIRNYFSG
ncbi:MAG: N-acetylmuramoyl-L-alanine amidase [Actinomycetota bacterium]